MVIFSNYFTNCTLRGKWEVKLTRNFQKWWKKNLVSVIVMLEYYVSWVVYGVSTSKLVILESAYPKYIHIMYK